MLIALSGLLITGFYEDCGIPAGGRAHPGTAIAGTTGGQSTVGLKVTRQVPFAVESLRDVQANAPSRQQPASRDRAIPFKRIQRPGDAPVFAPRLFLSLSPAVSSLFAPASMAPALDNNFAGLGNPAVGSDIIPPDTNGAAGPNHLVSILNSDFGVFDKAGNILSQVTLGSFWNSVWGLSPVVTNPPSPFDPKVLFDQHSGRFIAVSVAGLDAPNSWLLIAVSSTDNAMGTWTKVKIDADLDNTVQGIGGADFPGLGVDTENIYVAANMFSGTYIDPKAWAIPKAQLLVGSPLSNWYEFRNLPGMDSSMQPAHTFGTPGAEYIVYEGSGNLHVAAVTFPGGVPTWTDLGSVTVASFTSTSFLPGVPQLGNSNTIDSGDTRVLNGVYRNGTLWTTHHVNNGGKLEVAWYGIDPGSLTVSTQGRISHSSRWYVYPSIAVNQDNDVAVGFSGSSATEYISGYYTARKSGDASGTMQPVTLLKSGESDYFKTFGRIDPSTGLPANRWGDYSSTTVDPNDNVSFWTLQEYAMTPDQAGARSRWATWWGRFRPISINAPTLLPPTVVSSTRIDLSWTDASNNETGFKVERRLTPAGDYSLIATLGADNTSYIDNTGLAAGSTYSYRVQAYINGTGGSYSAEATATTSAAAAGGGGGGGGCAIYSRKTAEENPSPLGTILPLLSPLGFLAWRRKTARKGTD
jgi:hypothetical protein